MGQEGGDEDAGKPGEPPAELLVEGTVAGGAGCREGVYWYLVPVPGTGTPSALQAEPLLVRAAGP